MNAFGVPDLGALRGGDPQQDAQQLAEQAAAALSAAGPASVPGPAYYANDMQASLDPGGNVTVEFFFRTNTAVHDPVTVAMPEAVFQKLAALAPQVAQAMRARQAAPDPRAAREAL